VTKNVLLGESWGNDVLLQIRRRVGLVSFLTPNFSAVLNADREISSRTATTRKTRQACRSDVYSAQWTSAFIALPQCSTVLELTAIACTSDSSDGGLAQTKIVRTGVFKAGVPPFTPDTLGRRAGSPPLGIASKKAADVRAGKEQAGKIKPAGECGLSAGHNPIRRHVWGVRSSGPRISLTCSKGPLKLAGCAN
jgi:hypothetical protein